MELSILFSQFGMSRDVDPLVLHNGKFQRVSELIPDMSAYFEELKEKTKFIGVKQV